MPTNKDLIAVCNAVLDAKASGKPTFSINGVTFNDNIYDGKGGRCQENARKAFEAATGAKMPGAACCAGKTYLNLNRSKPEARVASAPWEGEWGVSKLQPGDFVFFSGGPKCHTCGNAVGHVGIWMGKVNGKEWMFQHTSREGLGITRQGPTTEQKSRFLAAFRLAPLWTSKG